MQKSVFDDPNAPSKLNINVRTSIIIQQEVNKEKNQQNKKTYSPLKAALQC